MGPLYTCKYHSIHSEQGTIRYLLHKSTAESCVPNLQQLCGAAKTGRESHKDT